MEIKLTLALPRDELSVPVARRILSRSLDVLGVEQSVIADIELALTEACTNVLDHATDTHEYELSAGIDGAACVLEVIDRGAGFDGGEKGLQRAAAAAEDGCGIQFMPPWSTRGPLRASRRSGRSCAWRSTWKSSWNGRKVRSSSG